MEKMRQKELKELLKTAKNRGIKKLSLLLEDRVVSQFLAEKGEFAAVLEELNEREKTLLLTLISIGEGELLSTDRNELVPLLDSLLEIEEFYREEGGVLGYVLLFLSCSKEREGSANWSYSTPFLRDLNQQNRDLSRWIHRGILSLGSVAAIFPVGGAGDRLNLVDKETGEPLPAGRLQFDGATLLEALFQQIAAFEYLYFKLKGEQIAIPVALMTSREKSNYDHIRTILEKSFWFHRDPSKILISIQPLSPVLTEEGRLSFSSPMKLNVKPGGHGVIWKLLKQEGIFAAFQKLGVVKAYLRQINNPIISLDYTLLAFIGCGFETAKTFGFLTAERPVGIEEGMIVEKVRAVGEEVETLLTNVEYTEFAELGLSDQPREPGSPFSAFPTNTNVLFCDLPRLSLAVGSCPFPGLIVNWKSRFPTLQVDGSVKEKKAGRLESTMQNIADTLSVRTKEPLSLEEESLLPTFACFHKREKTISTTKRSYVPGKEIEQTPEKVFYDLLKNHRDLLVHYAGMQLPPQQTVEEYIQEGPAFLVHYHPALGPLYSIIREKIRGGKVEKGSSLSLDIAELDLNELKLKGSLVIRAVAPFGALNPEGVLEYSNRGGKCSLDRVTIQNAGPLFEGELWKGDWAQKEAVTILIHGDGEFHASDVVLKGVHHFEVPASHRMVVRAGKEGLEVETTKIHQPTWYWNYGFRDQLEVTAKKWHT